MPRALAIPAGPRAASTWRSPNCRDGGPHRFLVEVGSERGGQILDEVPHEAASAEDERLAVAIVERTAALMGRELDTKETPRSSARWRGPSLRKSPEMAWYVVR
jgi:hypothetical protein